MSRLPAVSRDALSPEDQAVWDRIAAVRAGVRAGAGGPFGILMHVPALADRVAALEDYFRFNAALPAADRELVILATAREMGARYPWTRHEIRARQVGTRTEAIEAVRADGSLEELMPRERLLVEIVRALFRARAGRAGRPAARGNGHARGPLQPGRIGRERVRRGAAGRKRNFLNRAASPVLPQVQALPRREPPKERERA